MLGCGARRMGWDARLRRVEPMKIEHKLLLLGGLVGGIACVAAKVHARRRTHVDALDEARGRASIDDTPSLEPSRAPRASTDVQRLDESVAPAAPF
jgi:hypothetical protein